MADSLVPKVLKNVSQKHMFLGRKGFERIDSVWDKESSRRRGKPGRMQRRDKRKMVTQEMINGFLDCAAWADFEAYEIPEGSEFAPSAQDVARRVIQNAMQHMDEADIAAWNKVYSETRFGNRVYLDSVGHGTGFWAENIALPEGVGERLSQACGNREIHMWLEGETVLMESN